LGSDKESLPIFKLQARVIQIMCGVGTGTFCRQPFKDYQILAVTSQYVPEVICFIKNYKFSLEQNVHVGYLYIIMIQGKKKGIYMFGCVIQIS
jgi:hypothetical protein